jgi:hypothetical protein
MEITYKQLNVKEALKEYCEWLMEQRTDDFFKVFEHKKQMSEWYMVFYPVRAMFLGENC